VVHPDVEKHISAIQALCTEIGVTRLEFCESDASRFGGTSEPSCFIVTTPATENPGLWAGKLVELEERLSSLLGQEVDLLLPGALRNDWVREHVARNRVELYAVGQ
jgi:hypothetical protein